MGYEAGRVSKGQVEGSLLESLVRKLGLYLQARGPDSKFFQDQIGNPND